jgi:ABC-type phosphate transport system substrate-binding protein
MAVVALGIGAVALSAEPSFKVIVNATNPTTTLTRQQLSAMFLKETTRWAASGGAVVPVDLAAGSEIREEFSQAVHGRSTSAIKSHWQRQIFSGRGVPPPEKVSVQEVLAFVAATQGGLAYVPGDAPMRGGIKTIEVTGLK